MQGQLSMNGALVDLLYIEGRTGLEWTLRIIPATAITSFDVAVQSHDLVRKSNMYLRFLIKRNVA